MQKEEYSGVEISVNMFATEEMIVASSITPERPEFDGTQDPDDLPIL